MVDAVSGLGAVPIPQDEWGVDVVAAGSQKALMCPPGLGFASPNQKALDMAAGVENHAYYFDWQKTLKGQRKDPPDSPFTPAVSIFMGLDVALRMIEEEGLENVFERHRQLGSAARAQRSRRSGSSCSGRRTSAPTSSPPSRSPRASTAASCRSSCATATTSPPTAARTS